MTLVHAAKCFRRLTWRNALLKTFPMTRYSNTMRCLRSRGPGRPGRHELVTTGSSSEIRSPIDRRDAFLTDVAALDARIAKDEALQEIGPERNRLLASAAARYEAIFRRTGGYYPGINASTLTLLCGDLPRAESLAREVLNNFAGGHTGGSPEEYFAHATAAEAALIIGDLAAAKTALHAASLATGRDFSALATTAGSLN